MNIAQNFTKNFESDLPCERRRDSSVTKVTSKNRPSHFLHKRLPPTRHTMDAAGSRLGTMHLHSPRDDSDGSHSLPAPSPLPSPPLSLLSPGQPGLDGRVQHGRGYKQESRGEAYARVTECGGGGDYRLAGVLPLDGAEGARHVFVLHIRLLDGLRQAYLLMNHEDDASSVDAFFDMRSATLPLQVAWELFVKPALRCTRRMPEDAVPVLDFFSSFAERDDVLARQYGWFIGLCWRRPQRGEHAHARGRGIMVGNDEASECGGSGRSADEVVGSESDDEAGWRKMGASMWVDLVATGVPWTMEDGNRGEQIAAEAVEFEEACRKSGDVGLEDGAVFAAAWGQERELVEEAFRENSTMMRSWYLEESELAVLKIDAEDLNELPVWQLMGLFVRGGEIVRRLVLMLDHARVISRLCGNHSAAALWESERDRCLVAAGFTNATYCLVLNTQIYCEHQTFIRQGAHHPKPTRVWTLASLSNLCVFLSARKLIFAGACTW